MEHEESYVPRPRSKFKLPDEKVATKIDYSEIFEETPIYTLGRMFLVQALSICLLSMSSLLADY